MLHRLKKVVLLQRQKQGALAQLARALAWHARGHRFDSVMLHKKPPLKFRRCFFVIIATHSVVSQLPNAISQDSV